DCGRTALPTLLRYRATTEPRTLRRALVPRTRTARLPPEARGQRCLIVKDLGAFYMRATLFSNKFSHVVGKSLFLPYRALISGRNNVNDPVTLPLELSQQAGQHLGRLCLGVVKQHDAASQPLDAGKDEMQFLLGAHRFPVACPDIGAEDHHTPLAHAIEEG